MDAYHGRRRLLYPATKALGKLSLWEPKTAWQAMQVLDVWVEGRKDGWHYLQVGFKVKAEAASLFVGVQMKQKGLLMYALNDSLREFCF